MYEIRGEHRTEVTEVTEGGFGLGDPLLVGDPLFVNTGGFWREMCESGESIAQRSRRKRNRREDSVTPEF